MAARVEAHRDLEQEKTGMDSIGFYLFCLSIGYVIVWFLVNERTGNEDGEWGLLAMRRTIEPARPEDGSKGTSNREPQNRRF